MSDNPYQPSASPATVAPSSISKVQVRPIELLKRGYALIESDYWLFLGICFGGLFIASLVPFGIIMGPMMVGIFLCLQAKERGQRVEFGDVFKGFDQFAEAFIATLIVIGFAFLLMIPLILVFGMAFVAIAVAAEQNGEAVGVLMFPVIAGFYMAILAVSFLIYLPFLFTFALMAERKLGGMEAIKTSWAGVKRNFRGCLWYLIVVSFVSMLGAFACYVPAILLAPISMASLQVLYRDIYGGGPDPNVATTHPSMVPAT